MESALQLGPMALILFVAFVGGFVSERLRQPALIGYMLVGAVLGPTLFSNSAPTIHLLAELAVILLMFMLGLELDMARFKNAMRSAVLITSAQVGFGVLCMLGFAMLFHWGWQLAILYGFIIALSSTVVAVNMLNRLGQERTRVGQLAVATLVAQDLAAIIMLLVVSSFGANAVGGYAWVQLVFAVVLIVASLFAISYLQQHPRIVRRVEQLFTAGVEQPVVAGLTLAFGAAALSSAAGLSSAYGAFAIGLLLGNMGTLAGSYKNAMRSIHQLLEMAFFLSIGLLLNPSFLVHHWVEIVVILTTVILLKLVVNAGLLRFLLRLPGRDTLMLSAVLGQIGEFSFVLLASGEASGLLNETNYQVALTVIALSLALSPLVLRGALAISSRRNSAALY